MNTNANAKKRRRKRKVAKAQGRKEEKKKGDGGWQRIAVKIALEIAVRIQVGKHRKNVLLGFDSPVSLASLRLCTFAFPSSPPSRSRYH